MTGYNIRLNPNCASVVHTGLKFKSGDKGISFVITVDELDTTGTTAKIVFQRANGTSVESDITGADNVYTYTTLGNEFAVPGKTVADVKFYASENRVSTASFTFEVIGDTMAGLGAGTAGYSDRLEQLVAEAEAAEAKNIQAQENLEATEAEMESVLQDFKEQYGVDGALNPRGNWNSSVTYAIRDLAYYMGYTWVCLVANKGNAPVEGSTYWMKHTDFDYSNDNLLINADFRNPVNSSGLTEWSAAGTTIDGWVISNPNGVVTLNNDGLTITRTSSMTYPSYFRINQSIDLKKVAGKTVTLSAIANGNKYSKTFTLPDTLDGVLYDSAELTLPYGFLDLYKQSSNTVLYLRYVCSANAAAITFEYIKLELGSVATPPTPPNKEVEKLKCGIVDIATHTSTDLNAEYANSDGFSVCNYNNKTLNTPYTEGLTDAASGKCITVKSSATSINALQMALTHGGGKVFIRKVQNGTIGAWDNISDGGNADTVDGAHLSDIKGWVFSQCLRLDGSVPMSGARFKINNGYGSIYADGNLTALGAYQTANDENTERWLRLWTTNARSSVVDALTLIDINDVEYTVLHTGNSKPVSTGTSAPTDTTALWVDTANKAVKAYIDGAWTQVS